MANVRLRSLLTGMSLRMPWHVARVVLADHGLKGGHGWEGTKEKLADTKKFEESDLDDLFTACVDHILSGEKAAQLFKISKAKRRRLLTELLGLQSIESDGLESIEKFFSSDPSGKSKHHLVAVIESASEVSAIFTSVRYFETREKIDTPLDGYTEAYGMKRETRPAFDVLTVPKDDNPISLRVDCPKGITSEMASGVFDVLINLCNETFGEQYFSEPINIFPAIDSIYKDGKEGIVLELSFSIATGSLKNERMRRKRSCLRNELYHDGGKKAVQGDINPYKIAVDWSKKDSTLRPELQINGSVAILHEQTPVIGTFYVRNCSEPKDFSKVLQRINKHLPP